MNKYHLKNGVYVYSDSNHGFGTDAVVLADFARPKKGERSVDLGTGCGIIPLIWRARGCADYIAGIDISKKAIELCKNANENNSDSAKVDFICADLKSLKGVLPFGSFQLVTMNPPYKASNDGVISPSSIKSAANHELFCKMDDICFAASKLLQFGGRFCMCQRPARLCDMLCSMRAHRIEPKRIRFVQQRIESPPSLVLVEGRFGSKPGMTADNVMLIESDEMQRILNECYQKEGE